MKQYVRTSLPTPIEVTSIISIHYADFTELSEQLRGFGEAHDFWEFAYNDKGCFKVYLNGVECEVKEGQLLAFPPGWYHMLGDISAKLGMFSIDIACSDLSFLEGCVFTLTPRQRELVSYIFTEGRRLFQKKPSDLMYGGWLPIDSVSDYQLQNLKNKMEQILLELRLETGSSSIEFVGINQENYKIRQMEDVIAFLKGNIDKNLTLQELATYVGLSPSTLNRLFKKYHNCGPLSYFMYLKIEEAKKMILKTTMSVTQIATALGFNSVHYFSRAFKSRTGVSPTEYGKSIIK